MEISKELFSEVLGFEVSEVNIYNDLVVYSKKLNNNFSTDFSGLDINIYELAFKFKEWAFTRGYSVSSFKRFNQYNYGCVIYTQYSPECKECGESAGVHFVIGNTELEAITKACEWVLNEKQLQH